MSSNEPAYLEILLVEDEKFHQTMARKYLDKGNVPHRVNLVQDGEEALDFLYRRGAHTTAPRPDLILLDLGLPKMGGDEVFKQINKDPDLKQIPVIVLTGSDPDLTSGKYSDIPQNCRFTKWMEMKDFTVLVKTVYDYKIKFSKKAA